MPKTFIKKKTVKKTFSAVILAAGDSSRFWPLNQKHKSLTKVLGKPLLCYLIDELKLSGINEVIVVQSKKREPEKAISECGIEKYKEIKYAVQPAPLGTGDALLRAEKFVEGGQFFVLNADDNGIEGYVKLIVEKRQKSKSRMFVLASETKIPWLYGILKIEDRQLTEIIEKPALGKEPSNLKNDNFFFFPKEFFSYLKKVPSHPYSLIYAINLYLKSYPSEAVKLDHETLSLKYPWHLFPIMAAKLNSPAFKKFVSKSAIIGKNVIIKGKVSIGANAVIGDNTVINGPVYIGDNCQIGVSNVLRGPVDLEAGVKTGAFCEIKNCLIGKETHLHSGYIGDSIIGENCRFGAGFVSANRRLDRKNIQSVVKGEKVDTLLGSFGFSCGNNVCFGVSSSAMPGVLIGSDCLVGPGTVVKENLADKTLHYPEIRCINKKR